MKSAVHSSLVLALAVLAGCKGAPVQIPDSSLATVTPLQAAAGVLSLAPGVAGSVSRDGLANVFVSMTVREAPRMGFTVLAPVPGMPDAWNIAWVSLHSPSVNSAYNPDLHRRSLAKGVGGMVDNGDGTFTGRFSFPPLRPSMDYQARVFVGNNTETDTTRLAGSMVQDNVGLKAGLNQLSFDVLVNSQEGAYQVMLSQSGNIVGAENNITKDDVVTLKTGLMAKQPGIKHLDIKVAGAAYGNAAPTLVKSFDASASAVWDTFEWATDTAQGAYLPANLVGGTNFDYNTGALIVEAYNEREEQVGSAVMDIRVFGRPDVEVTLY